MAVSGVADYLDPTDTELDEAWRSVVSRVDPGTGRQVNFIPVEVVLCLCAMRVVDHTRFGSSSAARAPFPVPELARLFKRPNSSVLAKMANLDGSRPNGGKFDRVVFERLTEDSAALDALYQRIVRAARRQAVGPGVLPDFLGLVEFEQEPPVEAGNAAGDISRVESSAVSEIRWFNGLDGQIIVDASHVWITRENTAGYPFSTDPRRAPLAAVQACRVLPASDENVDGLIHILVDGADELPAGCTSHPDLVAFGPRERCEFEALAELLNPVGNQLTSEAPSARNAFLFTLDRLENLATAQELLDSVAADQGLESGDAEQLAEELDRLDDDPCVTWAWVGESWLAAGGSAPDREAKRVELLRAAERLVTGLSGNTGVAALFAAAAGTPLQELSRPRLAALWMALQIEDSGEDVRDGRHVSEAVSRWGPSVPPSPASAVVRSEHQPEVLARSVEVVGAAPRQQAITTRTSTAPESPVPPVSPPSVPNVTVESPVVLRNARVGTRWRVYLDCAGFRTVAVCDPATGATEITKGELKGRRYSEPTAAAAAIVERVEPGAVPPADGWSAWIVDDGSGRALAAVRDSVGSIRPGSTSTQVVPSSQLSSSGLGTGTSTASTADRGVAWFIEQVGRRGAKAVRITGTRRTAVRVEVAGRRPVAVRVKTRTDGTWQASKTDEDLWTDDTGARIWAFVDLASGQTEVFILPAEEVADGIRRATDAWVAQDPRRERTGHHAIEPARVRHGQSRWDLLGLPR